MDVLERYEPLVDDYEAFRSVCTRPLPTAVRVNEIKSSVDRTLAAYEEAGIEAYLPKPKTSWNKARGFFDRSAFTYIAEDDEYRCPAGERLTYRFTRKEAGKTIHRYWSSACGDCAIKPQCTTGRNRRVSRWEDEEILERAQARLDRRPRNHAATARHRGAPLRHDQVLDGLDALPDEDATQGASRDEPARSGLQHEASDQPDRNRETRGGDPGVGPLRFANLD